MHAVRGTLQSTVRSLRSVFSDLLPPRATQEPQTGAPHNAAAGADARRAGRPRRRVTTGGGTGSAGGRGARAAPLQRGEYHIHSIVDMIWATPGMNVGTSVCPLRFTVVWCRKPNGVGVYFKPDGVTPDVTHEPLEHFHKTSTGQWPVLYKFWCKHMQACHDTDGDAKLRRQACIETARCIFRNVARRCNDFHSYGSTENNKWARFVGTRRRFHVFCNRMGWNDMIAASPPADQGGVKINATHWKWNSGSEFHAWLSKCVLASLAELRVFLPACLRACLPVCLPAMHVQCVLLYA